MQLWQRRVAGILALGGGAIGVANVLILMSRGVNPAGWIAPLPFLGLYAGGIACGVALLERHPRALRANLWFWLVQAISVTSPVLSYFFVSGLHLTLQLGLDPAGLKVSTRLGSAFRYSLMVPDTPWSVGLNLVALGMFALLAVALRAERPQTSG